MDLPSIKKFLDSASGLSLREYLEGRLEELKNIDNVKDRETPTHLAVEVKATKLAYAKLRLILQDIMTFSEEVRPKDPRDNFHVE